MVVDFRRRFWISLIATLPILALSRMLQEWFGLTALAFAGDRYVTFVLSSFVFLYGGWPFLRGLFSELRKRRPGMMTLIALAISVAYVYSSAVVFGLEGQVFFWDLATLVDIMLLGHWIEMKSVLGASRALEKLARLMPKEAHRLREDGKTDDVPVADLVRGDRILVKPGEKVPADGKVVDGESDVNEAMLTGESKPVTKQIGSKVVGGAINGDGSLTVEVEKTGKDSYLSQVIELVREAQESKSRSQDLANRAAAWLAYIALSVGAGTLFLWLFVFGKDFQFALERSVTVMVITCPHALGLAVPLVVAVSTALAASNGLLIRNRGAFESARNIDAILFDKTGTLTEGRFGVTDVVIADERFDKTEILELAAAVEAHSQHPIAKGVVASAEGTRTVSDFKSLPGRGIEGRVDGRTIRVLSPEAAREAGHRLPAAEVDPLSKAGKTVVYVVADGGLVGAVALADVIREESKRAIERLKQMGVQCMMITGDNRQVADWVASQIGLDEVIAEVLPEHKAKKVREVQARGLVVAMTGDGVNDAPALAQADVGIAIGAGTDVAVETADIVLVKSSPNDVVGVISLAKATYNKIVQNLIWATGYNVVAIPLAAGAAYSAGILLSPALGAVLMSLSTVIVAINARLLRVD